MSLLSAISVKISCTQHTRGTCSRRYELINLSSRRVYLREFGAPRVALLHHAGHLFAALRDELIAVDDVGLFGETRQLGFRTDLCAYIRYSSKLRAIARHVAIPVAVDSRILRGLSWCLVARRRLLREARLKEVLKSYFATPCVTQQRRLAKLVNE